MQITLANNRQTRRRIHIRPNLTIMKGTIADLKFVRYGDIIVPIIMGKERRRVINNIVPQGLYQYVNYLLTVSNNAKAGNKTVSGWNSSPGNVIQLLNNGSIVQTLNATVLPALNGSTVIWIFIVNDLSSASYTANQLNLFASVNYIYSYNYYNLSFGLNQADDNLQYSPAFNLATATANIVKQSGEAISFVWEIQLNLGSSALTDFIYGILYSIPTFNSCGGIVGTFGGLYTSALPGSALSISYSPYYFSSITLQYLGGSSSANIGSITISYDGTNTYLVISASMSLSSQETATSVIINVSGSNFCINGQQLSSGSAIQVPYSATVPSGTINITVTIEFSPAT